MAYIQQLLSQQDQIDYWDQLKIAMFSELL